MLRWQATGLTKSIYPSALMSFRLVFGLDLFYCYKHKLSANNCINWVRTACKVF